MPRDYGIAYSLGISNAPCYVVNPMASGPPGGLSDDSFKSIALEVGDWIWGTVQGAFNEKATLSQIIVDAVIGMIPLVGDVTAARDLIAVVIGLCTDPRKREEKMQWILLVILLLALIPVIGGVCKGVGRLLIKVMGEVAHLAAGAERAARLAEAAKDIVAFLNRVGVGNAEKFLLKLKFADHQEALLTKLNDLLVLLSNVLGRIKTKIRWWMPDSLFSAIDRLEQGVAWLKGAAPQRLKDAIKELDEFLREIQQYVRSGGETTSKAIVHTAESGAKEVHRADELILLEGKAAKRTAKGGWMKNSPNADDVSLVYKHEPGFPDLRAKKRRLDDGECLYEDVATYSGQIVNRELQPGECIFRVFGPKGTTHGIDVKPSYASGRPGGNSFWGLNEVPTNAKDWRQGSAVLDEWNHDGFIVVGTVLPGHSLPACTGLIAEQAGVQLAPQYLKGGAKQAMIKLPEDVAKQLGDAALKAEKTGHEVIEAGGIRWELRATGWTDVNGIHGYLQAPGTASTQTQRVAARAIVSKKENDKEKE